MDHRRGISVIELIVVAAILGMLVCLVFPSMVQGRRKAVEARCSSNLRNVWQAVMLYAHASADTLPAAVRQRDYFWDRGEQRGWDILAGRAVELPGGPDTVWSCPAEKLPFMANSRSVGLDTRELSARGAYYAVTLRWWREPARLILCYDLQPDLLANLYRHALAGPAGDVSDEMWTPWPRSDATVDVFSSLERLGPHSDRFGMLFCDGHAVVGNASRQARAVLWTGPRWWPAKYPRDAAP